METYFLTYPHINISFFSYGSAVNLGLWPPCSEGFQITRNDKTPSLELLWTSDQPVAETSTEPHTIFTTAIH
jgi:hypothetical protein